MTTRKKQWLAVCIANAIVCGGISLVPAAAQAAAQTAHATVTAGNTASDPYTAITVESGAGDAVSIFWNPVLARAGVYADNTTMDLYLSGTEPLLTVTGTGVDNAVSTYGAGAFGLWQSGTGTLTVSNMTAEGRIGIQATAQGAALTGQTGSVYKRGAAIGVYNQNSGTIIVQSPLDITAAGTGGTAKSSTSDSIQADGYAYGAYNGSGGSLTLAQVNVDVTAVGGTAESTGADSSATVSASASAYGAGSASAGTLTLGTAGQTSFFTVRATGGSAAGSLYVSADAYAYGLSETDTVNGNLELSEVTATGGTISGDGTVSAEAYGLYAVKTVNGTITAAKILAQGKTTDTPTRSEARGIEVVGGRPMTVTDSVDLAEVRAVAGGTSGVQGTANAFGVLARSNLTITGNYRAVVKADGSGSSSETKAYGIASFGGTTKIGGDTIVSASICNTSGTSNAAYAVDTAYAGATYINTTDGSTSLGKKVQLVGDVCADGSGTNYIILDGSSSWLQGNIVTSGSGVNDVIVENGAVWEPVFDDRNGTISYDSSSYSTTANYAETLTLQNGGIIDLTWDNATRAADWRTLTIGTLSGTNGVLRINADLAHDEADCLELNAAAANTSLNIDVKYDPYFTTAGLTAGSTLTGKALVVSGDGAANVTSVAGVADTYNLYDYTPYFTKTGGKWYLTSYNVTNVQQSTASGAVRTAQQDRIGVNNMWLKEANSLSKRMGELREASPAESGAWARWNKGGVEQGSSHMDYNLIQAGYDRAYGGSSERTYRGVAVSYAKGSGSYELGSGDTKESTLSLYQTGIRQDGSYYDIILKAGKYIDDCSLTHTANPSHGDYSSWAYSVSGEYGRRYPLGGGSYIEPQGELILGRIQGADYTTSTGLHVNFGAQNKALTRLGAAIGRDFGGSDLYFKASWYHDFGSGISLTGSDGTLSRSYSTDIARDWVELILGGTVRVGSRCIVYGELSKYLGELTSNLQFNVGARWSF